MLLNNGEFIDIGMASALWRGAIGIDVETTGLSAYAGDKAFLLGFTDTQGNKFSWFVESGECSDALRALLSNRHLTYCMHNAKFELSFFREQFGIEVLGTIWDSEVMARVEHNNHMSYSLQNCALRVGLSKYQPMLDWLKERGNKGQYYKAPVEILVSYVEQDAWLSWELRRLQIETFKFWDTGPCPIKPVVDLECRVLRPLFEMESKGLLVDLDYCKRAIEYEKHRISESKRRFQELTAVDFVDSRKTFKPVFDANGIRYAQTALGNASFTEDALSGNKDHPVVRALLEHRGATKRLSTYWEKYLDLQIAGVIHPSINQNRAKTGRMSISDPSFQNVPTDEDEGDVEIEFPVRRAFIARKDCLIASLDYMAMELRKISDEAEDDVMIDKINTGADLHQDTADMAGVARSLAKNGRFARQYEGGYKRVAETLGVSMEVSRRICDAIDNMAVKTTAFRRGLIRHAEMTGWGFNFLGRRFFFDRGFAYTFPNYKIQGACAEILKLAIINVHAFLVENARPETYLILPIHDELVINLHKDDLHLLPQVKQIMIDAHTDKKTLGMDVSIHVGPNMHDMEKFNG